MGFPENGIRTAILWGYSRDMFFWDMVSNTGGCLSGNLTVQTQFFLEFLVHIPRRPRNYPMISHVCTGYAMAPMRSPWVVLGLGQSFEKEPDIDSFGPGPQFHRLQGRRGLEQARKTSQVVSWVWKFRGKMGKTLWIHGFIIFPFFPIKSSILQEKKPFQI